MKLHEILGRILTDVELRHDNPDEGVCALVELLAPEDHCSHQAIYDAFHDARRACTQTTSYVYPVMGPTGNSGKGSDFGAAHASKGMWRGEYGVNRRKLVRDCWRWAKERDV
jgi:hypothetical protein